MGNRSRSKPRRLEATNPDSLGDKLNVYVGPPVMGMSTRAILGKSIPPHAQALVDECPAVGRLIVPLSRMSATIKAGARPGGQTYQDIQEVRRHFNPGGRR